MKLIQIVRVNGNAHVIPVTIPAKEKPVDYQSVLFTHPELDKTTNQFTNYLEEEAKLTGLSTDSMTFWETGYLKSNISDEIVPRKELERKLLDTDSGFYSEELTHAWRLFLMQNPSNMMHFFAPNWNRCTCVKPAVWHSQAFCPICGAANFHYEGYVATYHGKLITTQDIVAFSIPAEDYELLEEVTEEYLASEHRMFDTISDDQIADQDTVIKIVFNNNSY
jgi:hypothetical protein